MEYSHFFVSNIGLLQGENLSPIMFSMFINDLKLFLQNDANLSTLINTAETAGAETLDDLMHLFLYSVNLTEYVAMDPGCLSVCLCVCL